MTTGESIADELRRALRGGAWHGPSLSEAVAGITVELAMQRPIPAGHNIWELVLHITSWATIATRRINGGYPEPFEGEDWPESGEFTPERWASIVNDLAESHEQLCSTVEAMTDEELARNAPGSDQSLAFMLHGVAQHGAYHGGQIMLLRKAVTTLHRRTAL